MNDFDAIRRRFVAMVGRDRKIDDDKIIRIEGRIQKTLSICKGSDIKMSSEETLDGKAPGFVIVQNSDFWH